MLLPLFPVLSPLIFARVCNYLSESFFCTGETNLFAQPELLRTSAGWMRSHSLERAMETRKNVDMISRCRKIIYPHKNSWSLLTYSALAPEFGRRFIYLVTSSYLSGTRMLRSVFNFVCNCSPTSPTCCPEFTTASLEK